MLEYASPLLLVTSTTSGAHSSTQDLTTTGTPLPAEVNTDTAMEFLTRAMERASSLHEGAVFSVTFSDEPTTPNQVMRLLHLMQSLAARYGLRYQCCKGWEFTFKKLPAIPGP